MSFRRVLSVVLAVATIFAVTTRAQGPNIFPAGITTLIMGADVGNGIIPAAPGSRVRVPPQEKVTLVMPDDWPHPIQWRKDGKAIAGATARTYVIPLASTSDSGVYEVTGAPFPFVTTGITLDVVAVGHVGNFSARLELAAGASTQIVGFYVSGPSPKALLIRAVGPSLKAFGISKPVAQPNIRFFDSAGKQIGFVHPAVVVDPAPFFASVGAFPLTGGDAFDYGPFEPGSYTVHVTDRSSKGGTVLVEAYEFSTVPASFSTSIPTSLINGPIADPDTGLRRFGITTPVLNADFANGSANITPGSRIRVPPFEQVRMFVPEGWSHPIQWTKDNKPISGATGRSYLIPLATTADSGRYNITGAPFPLVTTGISLDVVTAGHVGNFSARLELAPGAATQILGFYVGGTTVGKPLLIRAVGPSLKTFGITKPVAQPRFQIFDSAGREFGFAQVTSAADLQAFFSSVGAFPLTGGESAFTYGGFPPGAYSVHVSDQSGQGGTVLVEAYEFSSGGPPSSFPATPVTPVDPTISVRPSGG